MCSRHFSDHYFQLLFLLTVPILLGGCSETTDPNIAFEAGHYARAYQLWLPQAKAGNAEAQNAIGTMHYLGLNGPRSYREASEWFEKAAKQGDARAQRNLGMMYLNGQGIEQDYLMAYSWLYAADMQGNIHADRYIEAMANKITPNQQMQAERMADSYIFNPTADYVPRQEPPQFEPHIKDFDKPETGVPTGRPPEAG